MTQQFKTAKNLALATDKATTMLFKHSEDLASTHIEVDTGKRNSNKSMVVTIDLPDNAKAVNWSTPLTGFDREVLDTVNTLLEADNRTVTIDQIYRHMIGQPQSKRKAPKAMAESIERSMNGLLCRVVKIDATAEAKAYGLELDKATFTGSILSFESLTIEAGGKQVTAYNILSSLLFEKYSKAKKQVDSSLPVAAGNVPIRHTTGNIELVSYLKRRILAMRPTKAQQRKAISNRINVENMLDELGIAPRGEKTASVRKARSKALQSTVKILDYWETVICTDGKPFISGYLVHGKKPVKSIEIRF